MNKGIGICLQHHMTNLCHNSKHPLLCLLRDDYLRAGKRHCGVKPLNYRSRRVFSAKTNLFINK